MDGGRCPFTGLGCDGGRVYPDGAVGCGFMADGTCSWLEDVPEGAGPRDFYNEKTMEAVMGNGDKA